MSLAGKFFLNIGKDHLHLGQIVEVCGDAALVKVNPHEDCNCPLRHIMHLIPLADMTSSLTDDAESDWRFVATKEQLDGYMKWLEEDDSGCGGEANEPKETSATVN